MGRFAFGGATAFPPNRRPGRTALGIVLAALAVVSGALNYAWS